MRAPAIAHAIQQTAPPSLRCPLFSAHLKRRDPPVDAASQSAPRKVPLHLPQGRIGETERSLDVSRETSVRSSSVKREDDPPPSTRLAKKCKPRLPLPTRWQGFTGKMLLRKRALALALARKEEGSLFNRRKPRHRSERILSPNHLSFLWPVHRLAKGF